MSAQQNVVIINANFMHIIVTNIINRIPDSDVVLWNESFLCSAFPRLYSNMESLLCTHVS